jgi:cell wall-associated NlpC family hydrolase
VYRADDLRPGDIVLCEGGLDVRDPLGLLFVWASANPFQHAVLVGDGELLEGLDEVGAVPLDEYAPVGWRFEVAGASAEQRRAAVTAARSRVGQPYGYRAVTAGGRRIPFYRRLDPHDVVSSALVTWAFRQAGIQLSWDPLPSVASLAYSPLLVGPRPWLRPGAVDGPRSRLPAR